MRDPTPENITGEKVRVVRHEIEWSHLVWGVVALVVLSLLYDRLAAPDDTDDTDGGLPN